MVALFSFDPNATVVATNTFGITWDGLQQGVAHPDPGTRWTLHSGIWSTAETVVAYGGMGINETIPTPQGSPPTTPSPTLGGVISRATNITSGSTAGCLTGFSTFDQMYGMISAPGNPVPQAASGMQVGVYSLGSGQRLAVAMAPSLISLYAANINVPVSWDYVNQQLVPFATAYTQATISNAVWANTAGGQTQFTINVDYTAKLVAGDVITVSGVVNTGGTSTSAFNGQFIVVSVDDSTHVTVTQAATVSPGTYASGGIVAAGGGALPVQVLKVSATNNLTVSRNATTGQLSWNPNGAAALILL